jgi:hypothetical protein
VDYLKLDWSKPEVDAVIENIALTRQKVSRVCISTRARSGALEPVTKEQKSIKENLGVYLPMGYDE